MSQVSGTSTMFIRGTDISNISWNRFCYHRAYSSIYQKLFWKLTLFVVTILLQICLFIH